MVTLDHNDANQFATPGSPNTPPASKVSKHGHTPHKTEGSIKTNTLDSPLQAFFGTIPREIVCEVFSWLRPRDLVRLAEVNKELRSLLKSKESLPIWKLARERNWTKLPDCPTDLTELQWARLIFCLQCSICGEAANEVEWAVRMRVCDHCWNNYFLFQDSYYRIIEEEGYDSDDDRREADLEEVDREYRKVRAALVPRCMPRSPLEALGRRDYITFEPDVVKMRRKLKEYRTWTAAGKPEEQIKELLELIRKREEWVVYASQHAKLCREWDPPLASVELMEREEGRKRLIFHFANSGYAEQYAHVALERSGLDLTIGLDRATIQLNWAEFETLVRAISADKT